MTTNKITTIKAIMALVGGTIANFLGGYDALLDFFIWAVLADFLLGILNSAKKKQLSSTIAKWGFVNKVLYFLCIALCVKLDAVLGRNYFLRNVAIIWFLVCEGASILENVASLGLPLPDGIVDILVQVKNGFSVRIIDIVKKIVMEYKEKDKE